MLLTGFDAPVEQVVYLDRGARLELLSGRVTEDREGKGAFGGADARILSQTLLKYWNQAREQFGGTFCVTNGTFFYMRESPTRLPFPLKIDGEVISDGYAKSEFQDESSCSSYGLSGPTSSSDQSLLVESLHRIFSAASRGCRKSLQEVRRQNVCRMLDGDQMVASRPCWSSTPVRPAPRMRAKPSSASAPKR
jgi:hypothetical protein